MEKYPGFFLDSLINYILLKQSQLPTFLFIYTIYLEYMYVSSKALLYSLKHSPAHIFIIYVISFECIYGYVWEVRE